MLTPYAIIARNESKFMRTRVWHKVREMYPSMSRLTTCASDGDKGIVAAALIDLGRQLPSIINHGGRCMSLAVTTELVIWPGTAASVVWYLRS